MRGMNPWSNVRSPSASRAVGSEHDRTCPASDPWPRESEILMGNKVTLLTNPFLCDEECFFEVNGKGVSVSGRAQRLNSVGPDREQFVQQFNTAPLHSQRKNSRSRIVRRGDHLFDLTLCRFRNLVQVSQCF